MGYGSEVYEDAAALLAERRSTAHRTARAHRAEVAERCPQALEIEREISKAGLQTARAVLAGGDVKAKVAELAQRNRAQQQAFAQAMEAAGFPADYMEPHFVCPVCRDEGNVDGRMCECFKLALRESAYRRLNALTPLALCDFSNFDLSYYSDRPDEKTQLIPRRKMESILAYCKDYAAHFSLHSPSILMTGATGLGKTHLSLAIARAAIDRGFGVLYGSAQNFMAQLEKERFGRAAVNTDSERHLLECDLLILDDLGTEFQTQFVVSAFYNLINTRQMSGRPTIISTNLPLKELEGKYSQRVMSRIIGGYQVLPFIGHDVRQLKRMREMQR